ncbi:MAG: YeeE/YedE family protein [Bacteroidetes bacterium]|nr:YeeE/YedE family protein [Bacteroidota bacterium]MBK9523955.1 YeeE/YedE family protein [Bacteroidota bacterium]MBK9541695.1 YeeE/YedE family protein [Bacteroidota bacterium]MBP6403704.1 YeeE/YedE family protein [Bacteroidia bacterium]
MKMSRYILIGMLLGFTLYKSEAVSWFRIYEMFHFQNFHMFGIIGSAIVVGILLVQMIKMMEMKNVEGKKIEIRDKNKTIYRYLIGGFIFGLGWALAGACPAPMFILLGAGYTVFIVYLLAAMTGTFVYGMLRKRIPH